MNKITVRRATITDLELIVPLFDAYRVFYKQMSDTGAARAFLLQHFEQQSSVIFLAFANGKPAGFTQLYPSYSSVSMAEMWILNDLFVAADARGLGLGAKLLAAAKEFGMAAKAKELILETANDNPAQKLYERMGWRLDTDHKHYYLPLQ